MLSAALPLAVCILLPAAAEEQRQSFADFANIYLPDANEWAYDEDRVPRCLLLVAVLLLLLLRLLLLPAGGVTWRLFFMLGIIVFFTMFGFYMQSL